MYVKGNSAERAGGGLFLSDNAVANVTYTTFEENLARAGFKLSSGGCEVSGGCFYSPGYPSNYGNDERCEIAQRIQGKSDSPNGSWQLRKLIWRRTAVPAAALVRQC